MVLSLLIYVSLGIFLFVLAWHVQHKEKATAHGSSQTVGFSSWEIVVSIVAFATIAGARYHTGYDHAMYLHQYLQYGYYGFFTRDLEPLFQWVTQLMSGAGVHYFFYFALWAALQIGFIYYALRCNKALLPWVALYIMLGPFFLDWMNTMRQCVCECIFVFAIELIHKRKLMGYLCVVAVCTLLHKSAIILLPIYLIHNVRLNVKWMLAVMAVALILGLLPLWSGLMKLLYSVTTQLGYESYGGSIQRMIGGELRHVAWGPVRMVNLAIPILIVCFYPQVKKHFDTDPLLPYYVLMTVIWFCANNTLLNTNVFMTRPFEYFKIFTLVANAYLLAYLFETKKWRWFSLLLILSCSNAFFDVAKAVMRPSAVNAPFLYHPFFMV